MRNETEEHQNEERHHLQHEAEHEQPHKRMTVMGYLAVLFAAAFFLLLLSYFMQQRANTETIEGLKQSVSAVQSIDNLKREKQALELQRDELEAQVAQLETQLETLSSENTALQAQTALQASSVQAMDWFWRIQRELSRGRYYAARTLVEDFQAAGLEAALPADHPADPEGPSPAKQYQDILDVLY